MTVVQQIEATQPGTPENDRVKEWLALHGLSAKETPMQARFCIAGETLCIELFALSESGQRYLAPECNAFVKRMHCVDLAAAPEEYGIKTTVSA
jgi:hypothetical protein